AAHFRQAPTAEPAVNAVMEAIARAIGGGFELQRGKCVVELRPAGHDKGDALRSFMARAPFLGRLPLAIGDDLTDEKMFEAANELGGSSVRIGVDRRATAARGSIASPSDLRAWLGLVAA
ncbi:MAG: trehalose-phosphatase, partial [Mesorhizobium sp.]|nr:trehalose-phosphatase [Mesorhizobium sp.]